MMTGAKLVNATIRMDQFFSGSPISQGSNMANQVQGEVFNIDSRKMLQFANTGF